MKKISFFLLISFLLSAGNCFAQNDEEFIDQFLRGFRSLSRNEQVERFANARFVDGYIESTPEIAGAFQRYPEKKRELLLLLQELKEDIMQYSRERLAPDIQNFCERFRQRSYEQRNNAIITYGNQGLQTYMLPPEDDELLRKITTEQEEHFFILITLLQMKRPEEKGTPTAPLSIPKTPEEEPRATSIPAPKRLGRLARFLRIIFRAKRVTS